MADESRSHSFGDGWEFRFRINDAPRPAFGPEAEGQLRARLAARERECQNIRRDLLILCRSAGRAGDALLLAKEILEHATTANERSEAFFLLGQTMEHVQDRESAIGWYEAARESGTSSELYPYFIENNIGFCLNQLGRFQDARIHLRNAIGSDPGRANAYKNYGLSCEGLEEYSEGVRFYGDAVRADASDPRALRLLERVVHEHPGVLTCIAGMDRQLVRCREAVAFAAGERERSMQGSGQEQSRSEPH